MQSGGDVAGAGGAAPTATATAMPPFGGAAADAAAEGGAATYGAVCIDTVTGAFEFFAGTFSPAQVQKWKDECTARLERCNEGDLPNTGRREDKARQQIICQAELAVVPMAFSTWAELIAHRDVICFIDNDPAKDALILGSSRSDWSARVVRDTRKLCATLAAAAWYERVPSPSNVADLPSERRSGPAAVSGRAARTYANQGVL